MASIINKQSKEWRRLRNRIRWTIAKAELPQWFVKKKAWKVAYDARYRLKNVARKRRNDASWRKRNLMRARFTARRWKIEHPEQHREHVRKAGLKYIKAHPEKNRAHVHSYRARRHNVSYDKRAVADYMKRVFLKAPVKCSYCHKLLRQRSDITFDHIVPVSRGGAHLPENLCPSCRTCNARKHDKLLCELGWKIIR